MGGSAGAGVAAAERDDEEEGCHVTVVRCGADFGREPGLGIAGGIAAADRDSIADQAQALGRDGAGVTVAAEESVVSWRQRTSAAGWRSGR